MDLRRTAPAACVCVALLLAATAAADEALGPFPSWANARTDYGARGDGKADDSEALQRALGDLRREKGSRKALWLPAGTYRITRTLELLRDAHNESTGISILGEDTETTVIRWDGPQDGVMLLYNPWYARMGRLTLDGAGKALTAIRHGERFTTFNELSDMVFRDVAFGIEAGMKDGIAETAVLRCAFLRCSKAGISIQNFNSLDWWIWDSRFEDCRLGVTNQFGAGHFHVYGSLFRNSAEADMSMGNTQYFGIRNNTSIGSRAFFVAGPQGAGAQITFQGNTVVDPKDTAIRIGNRGPVLLLDNVFDTTKSPAVAAGDHTILLSAGNTFTVKDPIKAGQRFVAMDDRVVARGSVAAAAPELPGPLPRMERPVIEVPPGAEGPAIQDAIDQAAKLKGRRPVVHLPFGLYRVARTLVVPAGSDVQLVGDGVLNATTLEWAGEGAGPVLLLEGPCRATLREMHVTGGKAADGVVLRRCDQPGGRIFAEQLLVSAEEAGLLADGLGQTNFVGHDFGHSGCKVGVRVVGPGGSGTQGGRVTLFSGASSNNALSYDVSRGGWLLVRDMWYESGNEPRFMRCTESGAFTLHGAVVAHKRLKEAPGIEVDGFRGRLSFLGCCFAGGPEDLPAVVVGSGGQDTKVLLLAAHGNGEYFASKAPAARAERLLGIQYTPGGGAKPIADAGTWDDSFVREMLEQTRGQRPQRLEPVRPGATDARFYRVIVNGRNGVVLRP